MKRKSPRTASGGFTMVELLMTMLILCIVLVGLAALQLYAIRNVSDSKRANEATRLAQGVLESKYLSKPAGALPGGADFADEFKKDGVSAMTGVSVDGESAGPYTVTTLVEKIGNNALVTVKVTWVDAFTSTDGTTYQEKQVMVSTLRAP